MIMSTLPVLTRSTMFGRPSLTLYTASASSPAACSAEALPGGELRLRKGLSEVFGDAHHFAGRAHLRPEDGVYAAKLIEREDGRFDSVVIAHHELGHPANSHHRKIHAGEFGARHQARPDFSQGHAGRLADVRHRARGSWVHLENVHGFSLDAILHVHQADHVERLGQAPGVVADALEHPGREAYRGQHARRVARVHAGLLDMLHDAANDHVIAVGERVYVHFGGVFEKLVDQYGPRRAHQRRL